MTNWQVNSLLQALHNIASAIGYLAFIAGWYLVIGPIFWQHSQRGGKQ
jgi:hypothetical protein